MAVAVDMATVLSRADAPASLVVPILGRPMLTLDTGGIVASGGGLGIGTFMPRIVGCVVAQIVLAIGFPEAIKTIRMSPRTSEAPLNPAA